MRVLSREAVSFAAAFCLFLANLISATEKIDINTAPPEDLVKIIHIGEARALELISLRPFSSLDDLARIKGIGEKRVEDIKKQGLAWVSIAQAKPEQEEEKEVSVKPRLTEKDAAAVGEQTTEPVSLFVFLIAAALAAFSGTIILILKRGLK